MNAIRVGVATIGDERQSFYNARLRIVEEENAKLKSVLQGEYELVFSDILYTFRQADQWLASLAQMGVTCVIIHLPIWGNPSLAARVAQGTPLPVMLLGNRRQESSSLVTLLAAAGMLDQIGKKCIRVAGDIEDAATQQSVRDFARACNAVTRLQKSRYCAFGGRSIGIGTAAADPLQWQAEFGVDFDHCDQLEIVSRAKEADEQDVKRHLDWLYKNAGSIQLSGGLTAESLEKQVRSYLALKDIIAERGYDFLGIKCQTELSDGYALQCLGVALLNGVIDADGEKSPIPVSCECDCDGALTMYLLSLCAGGAPTSLMDIKFFSAESQEFILANCGSMAPFFAGQGDPTKALGRVNLIPHVFGKAGGASVQFVASAGHTTVARLCRKKGRYTLYCFEGETQTRPLEECRKTTWCYPHQFITADIDYEAFFQTIGSNHLHTVYGSYRECLKLICNMLDIDFVCYNTLEP